MNPIANPSRLGYFSIYTAWLAAFAMAGPLQGGDFLLHFLVPHILGFLAFSQALVFRFIQPALLAGVAISALGTALYPFAGAAAPAVMLLLGLASVPLSLRALMALKSLDHPLLGAAIALTLAHLLLLILTNLLPWPNQLGPLLLAILLLALIKVPPVQSIHISGSIRGISPILLVILFFQIVSGLMYAGLFPAYMEHGILAETHLVMLMYPLGAFLLLPLHRLGLNIPLLAGIFIALLGFSLWRLIPPPLGANLGMPVTLSATGLIDMVFLAHILSYSNLRKSVGYGLAVLCSGILLGRLLGLWVADDRNLIGLLGLAILNVTVMLLYLLEAYKNTRPRNGNSPSTIERANKKPGVDHHPSYLNAPITPKDRSLLPDGQLPPDASLAPSAPFLRSTGNPSDDQTKNLHPETETTAPKAKPSAAPPPPSLRDIPLLKELSEQEKLVLSQIARKATYRDIAQSLDISESSVKTYVQRIYRKAKVYNRKQLLALLELPSES
jgi:DNA-binding CsgD family transcriptional regulator